MKKQAASFFGLLLATCFTAPAFAESAPASGAQAVVCYDSAKQIQSAELLDLYETRMLLGRTLQAWPEGTDYITIAEEVAKRLDAAEFSPFVMQTETRHGINLRRLVVGSAMIAVTQWKQGYRLPKFVEPGVTLKRTPDAPTIFLPGRCKIKQLASLIDATSERYVSGEIWEKLDATNKAAYVLREAIYRSNRSRGEKTSEHTRRAVGFAFSNFSFKPAFDGIPEKFVFCSSGKGEMADYRFVAYENEFGKTVLQFLSFNGKNPMTKTTLTVDRQNGPLADPAQYVSDSQTDSFDELSDLDTMFWFHAKKASAKRVSVAISLRGVRFPSESPQIPMTCVPGSR